MRASSSTHSHLIHSLLLASSVLTSFLQNPELDNRDGMSLRPSILLHLILLSDPSFVTSS